MKILVVGGAGYIGAHMAKHLAERGHVPVVCDDFSTGHRAAVRWGPCYTASIGDAAALDRIFAEQRFDAVMHFAACSLVGESVRDPLKYYENNVCRTVNLLQAMRRHEVRRFVFSSTAAIFGEPQAEAIDEAHPARPINPYGRSKLMLEHILQECAASYGLAAVALRYFNAAGADPSGEIGEAHNPETHLIPRLLRRAAGEAIDVQVFGEDYQTRDGTCVRDYVHVNDLADAHLLALQNLTERGSFSAYNLGNGAGYTVREVLGAVERVVGRPLGVPVGPRRPGDPERLVASSRKAEAELGWRPRVTAIEEIIETAWRWHRAPAY